MLLKRSLQIITFTVATLALFACADKPKEITVDLTVTLNGAPLPDATVTIDGEEMGMSDAQGHFSTVIMRKYGTQAELAVSKVMDGYRTEPWSESFAINEPKDGDNNRYTFNVDVKAVAFVTIVASDDKQSLKGASVRVGKKKLGTTDDKGEIIYDFTPDGDEKATIRISKGGYFTWKKKTELKPGDRIVADLDRKFVLRVQALTEAYGFKENVKGVSVFMGEKHLGNTDENGKFELVRKGLKGKKAQLILSAPGHTPEKWHTEINLVGKVDITRYFYSSTGQPIRVGFHRFVANTDGEEIGDIPIRFQNALAEELFQKNHFVQVSTDQLLDAMKDNPIAPQQLATTGWKGTELNKLVDVIVFGSVSKNISGDFIAEAKFYKADGQLAMSQIATASNSRRIDRAAREIAINVREHFPLEGMIIAKEDDDEFAVNLGTRFAPVERRDTFTLYAPKTDKQGRITDYEQAGVVKIGRTNGDRSVAIVEVANPGAQIVPGSKVVRETQTEGDGKEFITVATKTLGDSGAAAVEGVNVYLDERWVGATNKEGKLRVPVRVGKGYDLALYRHGYGQVAEKIEPERNGALVEYNLQSYNAFLSVESEPSGAKVYIDGVMIGTTPLSAKPVSRGFHKVKMSAGGDYRDFESVVEFNEREVTYTGSQAIRFHTDYLRIGEAAERRGAIDAAIQAYSSTDKSHPDYALARSRLAQLYLDDKNNPDAAVREFENVAAIPEVKELVYKQFAVTYVNMGHAYHERANGVLNSDPREAARYLAKAITALQKAKKNSRFFPNESYDEAVHDTYYYLALSYHKLYQVTKKSSLLNDVELAWQEYSDFFPASLEQKAAYRESREAAERYMEQLKEKI